MERTYIDLPIAYRATIVRPRCQKSEEAFPFTIVPFEVRSASSSELSLVARVTTEVDIPNSLDPETIRVSLYADDGFLMRPVSPVKLIERANQDPKKFADQSRVITPADIEAANRHLLSGVTGLQEWPLGRNHIFDGACVTEGHEDAIARREWIRDDKAIRVAGIQSLLDEMILVDGVFYGPCAAPYWVNRSYSGPDNLHVETRLELGEQTNRTRISTLLRDLPYPNTFSAQAREPALAAGRNMAESKRHVFDGTNGLIEIYDPSYFPVCDMHHHAKECLRELDGWVSDAYKDLPADAFGPLADLRRWRDSGDENLDVAIQALVDLDTAWPRDHRKRNYDHPLTQFSRTLTLFQDAGLVDLAPQPQYRR
jgi:hypothetical protein